MNLHEHNATRVCRLGDIVPNTGVCALVRGRQIAIFLAVFGIALAWADRGGLATRLLS